MLSLIREGPKLIILESSNIDALRYYLYKNFHVYRAFNQGSIKEAISHCFDNSEENTSILFLVDKITNVVNFNNVRYVLSIPLPTETILTKFINEKRTDLINSIRNAPNILVMRLLGDIDKSILSIQEDLGGTIDSFLNSLNYNNNNSTTIIFTSAPLNKKLKLCDIHTKALSIEKDFKYLYKYLRVQNIKYVNKNQWEEMYIYIYDRYGKYTLHYERLFKILDYLELGLILGEAWGKEYVRPLMSIPIYKLKFFSTYSPKYIKEVLLGLEYSYDGTRIVDFDLYYNKEKISWANIRKNRNLSREDISMSSREDIMNKLEKEELLEINKLEKQIINSRN